MNRGDFQQLADVRIAEAGVLLGQSLFDGAYYLAGYSVECGLKACIARLINQFDFPDKDLATKCYTHNIETLVKSANLTAQREADTKVDVILTANWQVVKDWTEASRYERKTQAEAEAIYNAITNPAHGVLPWIKLYW